MGKISSKSWKSEISKLKVAHFVETFEIARRDRQGGEMKESASHHFWSKFILDNKILLKVKNQKIIISKT